MDEELRQAMEAVKEQQPVELNLEWYQAPITLEEIKQFIRANINAASRSFVAIGYYLKYVRNNQLYLENGFDSIWEFAKSEFGIGKSSASQFMSINDKFSKDGNSPILLEQYKDFSSSKLAEMLTLSDEQLEQINPTTTIVEIRQIKKPVEEVPETVLTSEQKEEPSGKCIHRSEFPCTLPEASKLAIGNGEQCNAKCCWNCSNRGLCGYQCNSSAHRPVVTKTVNTEPEYIEPVTDEEEDDEETPCDRCKYGTMTADEYLKDHPGTEPPCIVCDDKFSSWQPKDLEEEAKPEVDPDQVETVEADIIQTVPEETEPDKAPEYSPKYFLDEQKRKLNKMIAVDGVPIIIMERQKTIVCALASMVCDLENTVPEKLEAVQPELPILKNNDQRKEFIEAYGTWPIWIDQKLTGERYYRYDFDNEESFVIRVSLCRKYLGWEKGYSKELAYGREEYFMVKKDLPFVESETNKSAMIDYLKDLQKKGV